MTARRSRRPSNRWALGLVAGAGALALVAAGWFIVTRWPPSTGARPERPTELAGTPATAPTVDADAPTISATLYFVASNGVELVGVTREIPYASPPAEQARRIAEAQVARPPEGLGSAIPAGTTVRSVFVTERGEAYLDLSRELVTGHTGGTLNETLAVYALVNAMVANLPDVTAVQILVDGQEIDTLAGHLDLRHPLRRSSRWVRRGP